MMTRFLVGAAAAALLTACGGDNAGEAATEATEAQTQMTETRPAEDEAEIVQPAGDGEPVRWVVRDEDSTMVLFPTIHILPEDLEWRSEGLDRALAEADEVWFEIVPSEMTDQARAQELSMQYGIDQETPLSEKLDEETYARFTAIAEDLGLPPQNLEPMQPWLAAVTLQVMDLMRDGFQPGAGAEMVLAAEVPDEKERGLETLEEQLSFFGDLPQDVQVDFLVSVLSEVEEGQSELKRFAQNWAAGDISSLEDELMEEFREVSEELYQVFLVRRNERWVERLSQELEGSGNDFIAVGALHLVGEDGVPAMLADMGYEVEGPLPE